MRDEWRSKKDHPNRNRVTGSRKWAPWALVVLVASACGAAGERFAAETNDEYTEPLGEVTIGEPGGIVKTYRAFNGALVAASDGGASPPDAGSGPVDASSDFGGGKGGSSGAGGSSGSAGAFGAGGSFGGTAGAAGFGGAGGAAGSFGGKDGGAGSFAGGFGTGGSFIDGGSAGKGGFDGGVGGPSGFWHFDDCSPNSNFLIDSSGNGANAQHALKRTCAPGISGLGVKFADKKDVVQVPDEPQFTVGQRVAVAAWVNPTAIDQDHPIVLKRLDNKTAFSLGIHKGNLEMSVVLTNGKTFISRAPIAANAWTHVAGMYDGRFVFLFMNGEQVGQVAAAGTLRNVFAPIRIGATTQSQAFNGVIDEVWLSTNAVSKEEVIALSCIHRPSTFAVSPAQGGPVPFDTPVNYQIAVSNNDVGRCDVSSYELFFNVFGVAPLATLSAADGGGPSGSPDATGNGGSSGAGGAAGSAGSGTGGSIIARDSGVGGSSSDGGVSSPNTGIQANVSPFFMSIAAGATGTFSADVSGNEDAEPGLHHVPFSIFGFGPRSEFFNGEVLFTLSEPTGCFVRSRRELMITSTSVVDDPVRTAFDASVPTNRPESRGVWTFGRLMRDMARSPEEAPALAEHLFRTWLTDQTVNGFTVFARPDIQRVVLDNWPRTATGALDLDRSPLRLQAIVNRVDLRDLAQGNAGEGRFVFGVIGPFGAEQFTVILEYKLPAQTEADVIDWANRWHALGAMPFPSEAYNAALEAITLRFSGRGAAPGRVNGNAIGQLRTNEISLFPRWEFREFALSQATGELAETTVKLTPDLGFNGSPILADFVNQNQAAIIAEKHVVPDQFEGVQFAGGSVFNDLIFWSAPGIVDNEARHKLSINTCNGCHGPESGTSFLQISPRFSGGQEAFLSPFLTGTTVFDPFSGQPRMLNDLARRRTDLTGLTCAPTGAALVGGAGATSIAKGIQRVH